MKCWEAECPWNSFKPFNSLSLAGPIHEREGMRDNQSGIILKAGVESCQLFSVSHSWKVCCRLWSLLVEFNVANPDFISSSRIQGCFWYICPGCRGWVYQHKGAGEGDENAGAESYPRGAAGDDWWSRRRWWAIFFWVVIRIWEGKFKNSKTFFFLRAVWRRNEEELNQMSFGIFCIFILWTARRSSDEGSYINLMN